MAGGSVQISFDALEILTDEPANLFKLYAWLCVHLDRSTGVVGKRRRISEQYAKERMSVAAVQGRKGTVPTRAEIRNSFQRLVTLGLLVEKAMFVFSMPYEFALFSAQNNNNQTTTKQQPAQDNDFKRKKYDVEPDVSGNNRPPLHSINQPMGGVLFCMTDAFCVSEQFPARAKMAGFEVSGKDSELLQAALLDVMLYWQSERPNEQRNQVKWERTVLQTMKRLRQSGNGVQHRSASSAKPNAVPQAGHSLPPIPRGNDDLETWAKQVGAPLPTSETYDQYRRMLVIWRDTEMVRRRKGCSHG